MRRPPLAALLLVGAACSSSPGTGTGASSGDAGSDADASAIAEASTDDGAGPDAGARDAASPVDAALPDAARDAAGDAPREGAVDAAHDGPDDGSADAPPSLVTVVVVGVGGPEPGVTVVFGDAGGSILGTAPTDAQGIASWALAPGGSVSALLGSATYPRVFSVLAVQPGDTLVVHDPTTPAPGNLLELMGLPAAPIPGDAGLAYFNFLAGACQMERIVGTPVDIPFHFPPVGCLGLGTGPGLAATYPSLLEAVPNVPDRVAGYTFNRKNPLASNDAGAFDLSMDGGWSSNMTLQTLSVASASDASPLSVTVGELADGVVTPLPQGTYADGTGNPTSGYLTHPDFADALQIEVNQTTGASTLAVATRQANPAADGHLQVDFAATSALPVLDSPAVQATATPIPAVQVTWNSSPGTLGGAAGILAYFDWSIGGASSGRWVIVSPGTSQGQIVAPPLPVGSAWFPPAGSFRTTIYGFYGSALPYSALRSSGSGFQMYAGGGCLPATLFPPLPLDGTVLLTAVTRGGC